MADMELLVEQINRLLDRPRSGSNARR